MGDTLPERYRNRSTVPSNNVLPIIWAIEWNPVERKDLLVIVPQKEKIIATQREDPPSSNAKHPYSVSAPKFKSPLRHLEQI